MLINAGRGGLQNEADILQCLDDGTLGGASLDVYATEPLPADSPFWTHPKVVLTPHNAADTDPDEISKYVAQQIARFEAGGALENVVDRSRGINRCLISWTRQEDERRNWKPTGIRKERSSSLANAGNP